MSTVSVVMFLLSFTELELMKERFSRLLLGEDMSGGGKGVCTAVTISNAITNLYGNSFRHCIVFFVLVDFLSS